MPISHPNKKTLAIKPINGSEIDDKSKVEAEIRETAADGELGDEYFNSAEFIVNQITYRKERT